MAVRMGRMGLGIELKNNYFNQAVLNLKNAELEDQIPCLSEMDNQISINFDEDISNDGL
jgi:hypothetical protein